jgi:hypothetical protein
MADKQQRFTVRHIATGRKVPIHPDLYKDPTWLSENGYMKTEALKPFEKSAVSREGLPPLPPVVEPTREQLKEQLRKELAEEAKVEADEKARLATEAKKEATPKSKPQTIK